MSNIAKAFANGKAFIPFITCGDPDLETTAKVVRAMAESGADLIELGIPFSDPTYNTYQDIWELPGHIFDEMAHFFSVYKALEGKEAVAGDVNDRKAAIQVICKAMDHYNETFLGSSDHTPERHSSR